MARFISKNELNSTQHLANAGIASVGKLVEVLAGDLEADERTDWTKNILGAFATNERAVRGMDLKQLMSLSRTVGRLNREAGATISAKWLSARDSWSDASVASLTSLMKSMVLSKDPQKAKLIARIDASLVGRDLHWETARKVAWAYSSAGDGNRAQAWTKRTYQAILGSPEARAKAGPGGLNGVADDLYDFGLTVHGRGYNEYAVAVAQVARKGTLGGAKLGDAGRRFLVACHWLDSLWGKPLQSAESRRIVRGALIDPQGVPRVKVGKILAWAHRNRNSEFKKWTKYVDGELAKSGAGSDARAAWLMIKAHSAAIRPNTIYPSAGIRWLRQAVAAARSEPMRLAVVDELTDYFEQKKCPELAVSLIESIAEQFSGQALMRLRNVQQRARQAHEVNLARAAASRARQELATRRGRAGYYRKMLARAAKRNDQKAVAQLRTAIAKLHQ